MMSDIVIKAENLSKKYVIGHQAYNHRYLALRDVLMINAQTLWSKTKDLVRGKPIIYGDTMEEVWALKDVTFEIHRGEVVGIIGRNGAGKSTLLKILSRITEPSTGRVTIKGRVASLLEVGTGFHPELTGRENIYLNGTILGMTRAGIKRKFDEIVAFAEIEKFLDTPVKRYSSGMYVRLAFAVAAHLDPEILVVDEVLAVGDAQFQKKCMGKMKDVTTEGRTVLLVSHNMQVISTLSTKCILLSSGKNIFFGPTYDSIKLYLNEDVEKVIEYSSDPSDYEPRITRIFVNTSEPSFTQVVGKPIDIEFEINTPYPINGAALSFQVMDNSDNPVLHVLTLDSDLPMCRTAGFYRLICRINKLRLYIGDYSLKVHFAERPGGRKFQTISNVCPFKVVVYGELRDYYWQEGAAKYVEDAVWQIENIG
jgi:lipopolysaccharide transport system ATP-binding protein